MAQYIYLVKEREFVNSNKNIFKIGKTTQENTKRVSQYPKGSILYLQILCQDCSTLEKQLINIFKSKYSHRNDIGNEYFEGSYTDMINDIYCSVINEQNIDYSSSNDNSSNDLNDYEDDIEIIETVDTYQKLLKHVYNLECIIITDTKERTGFLKFKDELAFVLTKDGDCTLKGFLNHFDVYSMKLMKNICYECQEDKSSSYVYFLKYNEFVLHTEKHTNTSIPMILDTSSFSLRPIQQKQLIPYPARYSKSSTYIYDDHTFMNTDISIVHNILNSLIDPSYLLQYRKLCYNILVDNYQSIVFRDYSHYDNLLTYWIFECINRIGHTDHPCGYFYEITDISNISLSSIQKENPRVVFLRCIKITDNVDHIVTELQNMGIKNIVISYHHCPRSKSLYDFQKCYQFLLDHPDTAKYVIHNSINGINSIDTDIFVSSQFLFNNYLRWLCINPF